MTYGMKKDKMASKKGGMKKSAAKKGAMKKGAAKSAGLSPAQKKLPPFIQKAIMDKKKKGK